MPARAPVSVLCVLGSRYKITSLVADSEDPYHTLLKNLNVVDQVNKRYTMWSNGNWRDALLNQYKCSQSTWKPEYDFGFASMHDLNRTCMLSCREKQESYDLRYRNYADIPSWSAEQTARMHWLICVPDGRIRILTTTFSRVSAHYIHRQIPLS